MITYLKCLGQTSRGTFYVKQLRRVRRHQAKIQLVLAVTLGLSLHRRQVLFLIWIPGLIHEWIQVLRRPNFHSAISLKERRVGIRRP